MKTVFTIAATLISAASFFGASPANAAVQGFDQYSRSVLGDTTIAAPAAATRTELVAGSYAKYLITNGAAKSGALAAASVVGEREVLGRVDVEAPKGKLSAVQAYQKSIGNEVTVVSGSQTAIGE